MLKFLCSNNLANMSSSNVNGSSMWTIHTSLAMKQTKYYYKCISFKSILHVYCSTKCSARTVFVLPNIIRFRVTKPIDMKHVLVSLYFFSCSTIPITLTCFKKKKFVDARLAQFLLPIETVLYVPGTAIYIAVVAIFLVQTFHPNMMSFTTSILIW